MSVTLESLSVAFTADAAPFLSAAAKLEERVTALAQSVSGMEVAFAAAGSNAGAGLAEGLLSRLPQVTAAARALADAAAGALRGALQIHSPSRVTRLAGEQFDRGFAEGIAACLDEARAGADRLAMTAAGELTAAGSASCGAAARESGDIRITIPIELDGYVLTTAVLDGIRELQSMSGRQEVIL